MLQVAKTLSDVLGITITHTRVGADELKRLHLGVGLSEERAAMLVTLENLNASGVEEKIFATPTKVYGKMTLKSFVDATTRMLGKPSRSWYSYCTIIGYYEALCSVEGNLFGIV